MCTEHLAEEMTTLRIHSLGRAAPSLEPIDKKFRSENLAPVRLTSGVWTLDRESHGGPSPFALVKGIFFHAHETRLQVWRS